MSSSHDAANRLRYGLATVLILAIAPSSHAAAPPNTAFKGISQSQDRAVWAVEGAQNPAKQPAHPPGYYAIGSTPNNAEIAGWTIAIPPDGANLPPGNGTVDQGATIYAEKCAMCHGVFGQGKHGYPQLAGGVGSLGTSSPTKTLGSYWPYATTVWDYINRAMPFYAPHTLKPDQVYAVTAYVLNLNSIVPATFIADAKSIPTVKMPNRNGFNWQDPRPLTHNRACTAKCVDPSQVKITSNAATTHLTPRLTGPVDHMTSAR